MTLRKRRDNRNFEVVGEVHTWRLLTEKMLAWIVNLDYN